VQGRLRLDLARERDMQALLRQDITRLELQLHELHTERAQDNVAQEALEEVYQGIADRSTQRLDTIEKQRAALAKLRQEVDALQRKLVHEREEKGRVRGELAVELRRMRGLDLEQLEQTELAALRSELEEALERTRVMGLRREAELVVAERLSSFLCPITCLLMRDPVIAADGHTYERSAITKWFASRAQGAPESSPKTALPMANTTLIENFTLKSAIDEAVDQELLCLDAGPRKRRVREAGGV